MSESTVEFDDSEFPPRRSVDGVEDEPAAKKPVKPAAHAADVRPVQQRSSGTDLKRTLTREQATKARIWAKNHGYPEEYGLAYFMLPLEVRQWTAENVREVVLSFLAEPLVSLLKRVEALEKENAELRAKEVAFDISFDSGTKQFSFSRAGKAIKSIFIPVALYRGVWQEKHYLEGDRVTMGGNEWAAKRATDARPGTDDSWQLSVRKGRDAKNA